jgi:Skp family chaperone for outer membrane proteins
MKGILSVVAALLLLNVAALSLWSRVAPPPAAAKSTRVGVFNLSHVVKNYAKFKDCQDEMKKRVGRFQEIDARKKKSGEKIAEELQRPDLTADRRAELGKKLIKLQREIEDNKAEAQATITKEQERQLKTLYAEIGAVARRLARERGLDLVMHHNDVSTETERTTPANISRKMQAGAFIPIYIEPDIDLTESILEDLHEGMKRERL